ncbi:MAG: cytochrome c biogenesis protein CcdA [Bacteroidota bacterium]
MRRFFLLLFFFLIGLHFSLNAASPVKLVAKPSKLEVKKGEKFDVQLTMTFDGHWYSYSLVEVIGPDGLGPMPTVISAEPKNSVEIVGKVKEPKPKKKFDKAFEIDVLYHKGTVNFIVPLVAKKDLNFAKDKVKIIANMQLCEEERCLPPEDYSAIVSNDIYANSEKEVLENDIDTVSKNIVENPVDTVKENITKVAAAKSQPKSELEKKKEQGILSFLWFSMTAGALALLTPCVFPMVPITVSFFTKRAEKNKGKGLRDALVYAFGIIFTFTGLGFLFSILFGASGIQDFTSSPWVNFVIALIFIVFAYSLFGAFELQIPTSITNKLNQKSMQGEGIFSVILMGLTFSLASFSCTGPLVAAALVSAASGEWFYPIISMLGFSTVLAAPFFLLALFPTALSSLPRAGGWMNNIKVVLGFLVIAATLKFLNNAFADWGIGLSREIFIAIWVACLSLATLYILGIFKMSHDAPIDSVSPTRLTFAILFASITLYVATGFFSSSMGFLEAFLPAPETTSNVIGTAQTEQKWFDNIEQAKIEARNSNKLILLDFTGKHCPNCRLMERNIFTLPEVAAKLNELVKVKLITDLREEPYISNKKYQMEHFNSVAIPFYVLMNADGKVINQIAFTTNKDEFLKFLNSK